MSVDCSVGDPNIISQFNTISQICVKLQDIHDYLSNSPRCDVSERVKLTLVVSKKNLEVWQKTWLSEAGDSAARLERFWGKDGLVKVQELLEEIFQMAELLKDTDVELDKAKDGRKPIWKLFRSGQLKKSQVPTSKSPSALDLALELSKTIEWLSIYSDVLFELLHGTPTAMHSLLARDQQLSRCVTVRQGAVALDEACQRSTQYCELELDFLSDRGMPTNRKHIAPLASETSLFYHITVGSANNPKVAGWNFTAQSLQGPEVAAMDSDIKVHEEPDLAALEPSPLSSSHVLGIQPSFSGKNYYFQVTTAHTTAGSMSESERSALRLKSNRRSTEVGTLRPLAWRDKLDLAYNLVQSGFYLLGTPWLASLSSKNPRIVKTEDRAVFILDVKTTELQYFIFEENPHGLSDLWQLFQVGLILIDIALDDPDTSSPARLEDPHSYAAKKLSLVYQTMGANYTRACAFCVKDRRSPGPETYDYQHDAKYAYPEKTCWIYDLKDLLKEYHKQVVSG